MDTKDTTENSIKLVSTEISSNEPQQHGAPPTKKGRGNEHIERESREVPIPKHRFTPLKENWLKIFEPVTEHLKVDIRFNLKTKNVEIRSSKKTEDISYVQKGK